MVWTRTRPSGGKGEAFPGDISHYHAKRSVIHVQWYQMQKAKVLEDSFPKLEQNRRETVSSFKKVFNNVASLTGMDVFLADLTLESDEHDDECKRVRIEQTVHETEPIRSVI